jgi:hypothetical protein
MSYVLCVGAGGGSGGGSCCDVGKMMVLPLYNTLPDGTEVTVNIINDHSQVIKRFRVQRPRWCPRYLQNMY